MTPSEKFAYIAGVNAVKSAGLAFESVKDADILRAWCDGRVAGVARSITIPEEEIVK